MQTKTGYDWENLRTFLAVARAGSARAAAAQLGVHYTSLSRRLQNFEKKIGARLFDRGSFGYVLTPYGEAILPHVRRIEEEAFAVERLISGADARLRGDLRITMPESVASYLLIDELGEFARLYPEVTLAVDANQNFADLLKRQADIAIRVSNDPPDYLIGTKVGTYYDCIYATPAYLAAHDPADPNSGCQWIGWSDGGSFTGWLRSSPFANLPVGGWFPNELLQLRAACAGIGLAQLPCFFADREPSLVRVAGLKPQQRADVWLLTHPDFRRTARVRAMMDFMRAVFRKKQDLLVGTLG